MLQLQICTITYNKNKLIALSKQVILKYIIYNFLYYTYL